MSTHDVIYYAHVSICALYSDIFDLKPCDEARGAAHLLGLTKSATLLSAPAADPRPSPCNYGRDDVPMLLTVVLEVKTQSLRPDRLVVVVGVPCGWPLWLLGTCGRAVRQEEEKEEEDMGGMRI